MYCTYGSFAFTPGEAMVTSFRKFRRYNSRGEVQGVFREAVIEGEIIASGQDAINTRASQILNAFALDGGFFALRKDSGVATEIKLGDQFGVPTRVLECAIDQEEGKGHFATGLPFRIVLGTEANFDDDGGGNSIRSYQESITVTGAGLPRRIWVELDTGPPVLQIVSTHTPIVITQSGSCVGESAYPEFNVPVFPLDELDSPDGYQQIRDTPQNKGNRQTDWPVRWNYRCTVPNLSSVPFPLIR